MQNSSRSFFLLNFTSYRTTLVYIFVFVLYRLADHFGGKLHMGFIKIRDRLAELKVCFLCIIHVIFILQPRVMV